NQAAAPYTIPSAFILRPSMYDHNSKQFQRFQASQHSIYYSLVEIKIMASETKQSHNVLEIA
ncbi:MAG: hypothetical protein Q8O05_00435, partial [Chloroflexota bacterium]|nr:hypothetical protein [Chloroflexota bacterium]